MAFKLRPFRKTSVQAAMDARAQEWGEAPGAYVVTGRISIESSTAQTWAIQSTRPAPGMPLEEAVVFIRTPDGIRFSYVTQTPTTPTGAPE